MHFSGIAAVAATGVLIMSLGTGAARSVELVVISTISAKEALIELVPEFEHSSGHKVNITYAGGSDLANRIRNAAGGN